MNLPQGQRGQLMAVGLLLIPLLLLWQFALKPAFGLYLELQDDISTQQDQLARYQRIAAGLPELQAQQQRMQREQPLAPFLLEGKNRALASASLQRTLQELVRQHGGRILSLRTLKHEATGALERLPLDLRFQVDTRGLREIIYALESSQRITLIDQVNITARQMRGARDAGDLDVRLTLYSLRPAGTEDERG